jgi:hypothetical protein
VETCDRDSRGKRRQTMAMKSAQRERKLLLSATANDARTFYFPVAWRHGARSWKARPRLRRRKPRLTSLQPQYCRPALTVDRCRVVAARI